ncbi:MAG: hypothetical protein LUD47_05385 [Clostridia bacterium]|nr:hypothetical protein [Clostridia bacterium]
MKKKLVTIITCIAMAMAVSVFFAACGSKEDENSGATTVEFYMPDGAPALSAAYLMSGEGSFSENANVKVNYNVVDSSLINTYVTGSSPKADVCILPVNAAGQLLGSGETYTLLGTVTHGNLFLVSAATDTGAVDITSDNLDALVGKDVGVLNLSAVPGMTFEVILNDAEIPFNIVDNDGERSDEAVNLYAMSGPGEVLAYGYDYGVVAEPAMSLQVASGNLVQRGSLQELYGGESGYPQAVMVAKNSLIESDPTFIDELVAAMKEGSEWLLADTTDMSVVYKAVEDNLASGLSPTFTEANLSTTVIENCAINFVDAADCKDEIKTFLDKYTVVNGVEYTLTDGFFYGA